MKSIQKCFVENHIYFWSLKAPKVGLFKLISLARSVGLMVFPVIRLKKLSWMVINPKNWNDHVFFPLIGGWTIVSHEEKLGNYVLLRRSFMIDSVDESGERDNTIGMVEAVLPFQNFIIGIIEG